MIERYSLFAADSWTALFKLSHNIDVLVQSAKYRTPTNEECRNILQIAQQTVDTISFTCSFLEPTNETNKAVQSLKRAYLELHRESSRMSLISLSGSVAQVLTAMKTSFGATFYFRINESDLIFYRGDNLFGALVKERFPLLEMEIQSAGKCLALKQSTACVFHLMRVIESTVKQLGRKLKIEVNVDTENWASIIARVNGKIDQLPKKTRIQQRKKARYAEASTYLNSIRIAWRNEVMHPHETYTEEQARKIFFLTRDFMVHLAELI